MISETDIRQNSLKAWILAARPKTLTAAAVPVMIAVSLAYTQMRLGVATHINVVAAVLCFLFAFVMQIDANFVNDYFDCVRGNDDETRLGPKRACAQGWISLPAMRSALVVTTVIASLVGLPLAYFGGSEMILVGISCVVFCFLYTTTLSYIALGDLLVLLFFGIVPVCCTYYVVTSQWDLYLTLPFAIACGLVVDTLLIVNNYRDIDNDRRAGKRTLIVFIGRRAAEYLYLAIVPLAVIINMQSILAHFHNPVIIPLFGVVLAAHLNAYSRMKRIGQGRELNSVLGLTASNIFIYGVILSLIVILV